MKTKNANHTIPCIKYYKPEGVHKKLPEEISGRFDGQTTELTASLKIDNQLAILLKETLVLILK